MKIIELDKIMPDYIDISLDGNKEVHDFIRGEGTFDALMSNLQILSKYKLHEKVFISFTLNRMNVSCIDKLIKSTYDMKFKNILISPYVTLNKNDMLYISDDEIIVTIQRLKSIILVLWVKAHITIMILISLERIGDWMPNLE